jgi:hypothetical protein
MNKVRCLSLLLVVALAGSTAGCNWQAILDFLRSAGFVIHTMMTVREAGRTRFVDHPGVLTFGIHQRDFAGAAGDPSMCDVETDLRGRAGCPGKRAPAIWEFFYWGNRHDLNFCINQRFPIFASPLGTHDLVCNQAIGIFFTSSPDTMDVQAPPQSFTVSGQGISTEFGMPVIEYWDQTGTVVAQATAAEVAPDGTWIRANTPALDPNSTWGGAYTIGINNVLADGTYNTLGYASLAVTNSNPPPLPEYYPEPTPEPCPTSEGGPQMECGPVY